MPFVKINGVTYDVDAISDEVKGHLRALSFIDAELDRIGMQLSVLRISREEIGRRLDLALTRQELNRPDAAVPAAGGASEGPAE
ncbi:MAG: hypothetical protein RLZ83_1154 [Pseudomonadota bacterium]|jgi:hypothetical protein